MKRWIVVRWLTFCEYPRPQLCGKAWEPWYLKDCACVRGIFAGASHRPREEIKPLCHGKGDEKPLVAAAILYVPHVDVDRASIVIRDSYKA